MVHAAVRQKAVFHPIYLLIAYISGVALSLIVHGVAVSATAGALAALLIIWGFISFPCPARLAIAFACLGLMLGSVRLQMLETSMLSGFEGKWAVVAATVASPPRTGGNQISFVAHAESVRRGSVSFEADEDLLVRFYCSDQCPGGVDGLGEGMRVRVGGILEQPPSNGGADFDYGIYLRRRGINMVLSASTGSLEQLPPRTGPAGLVDAVRRHARESLAIGGWGAATGVLKGMVMGDTNDVPDEVISDFRDAGLLHLMAVSGQNVVLLGFIVMLICRALMVPRLPAALIAMLAVGIYVPLTGAGPSIVRAGIVGELGLLAFVLARQTNRYYFLALAAAIILSLNPYSLMDPGFQLSFAAVLAIFLVAPAISAPLGFLPRTLREGLAISTGVGLVTAPIMLIHFHAVSLVTVPANLAAEPVAGPVMLLGALSVLAAPVSRELSWMLNTVGAACTGYLIAIARFFARQPGAVYNGNPPSVAAIALFYAVLAGMVAAARTAGLRAAGMWLRRRRWLLPGLLLLAAAVAGLAYMGGGGSRPPADYTVSFLDVGQGDAILVQVPGGATLLIDGGPGSIVLDRLKESGVSRIDAVFLSHPHADHLDGLIPVLDSYPVGQVYDAGPQTASPEYRDFLGRIGEKGIPYSRLRQGDALAYGDLSLKVLSPARQPSGDDANTGSLVMLVSYHGLDILCPGDAEGEVLASLDPPPVQVLKVSHHGSRDDELEQALRKLNPQVAVISVAQVNQYGHPAQSTLDKLRKSGASIFQTRNAGTVRVSLAEGQVLVSTQR